VETVNSGYTDSGYVNYNNESGSSIEWNVNTAKYGAYKLMFRYANGTSTNRAVSISINGNVVWNSMDFNSTGAWTNWSENSITLNLNQGTNLIKATAITADGGPNVDYLKVAFTTESVTTPTYQPIQTPTPVSTPVVSSINTGDGTTVTSISQLKSAISTAESAKILCNMEPKVAMLSFSTKGSADHELVDKVRKATEIAKQLRPDLQLDGELQLDAALVKKVADQKAPESSVAGQANVLIFPDLQSGNIGYKLVQRFAGAEAIGPVCQGFAKPVNDLSRGCSAEDIVNVVVVTAVQAQTAV
jgi:hypothetical protein